VCVDAHEQARSGKFVFATKFNQFLLVRIATAAEVKIDQKFFKVFSWRKYIPLIYPA